MMKKGNKYKYISQEHGSKQGKCVKDSQKICLNDQEPFQNGNQEINW